MSYESVDDLPREQCGSEWDGGWFCERCWLIQHWKTKAYKYKGKCLCRKCAEKEVNGECDTREHTSGHTWTAKS